MRVLGADEHIVAVGNNYTKIFMCFAPMFMCNYVTNAFVRNDGAPGIAMSATLFSSLFNIVFDYILMFDESGNGRCSTGNSFVADYRYGNMQHTFLL